jgi:hypothetical protein
VRGRDEEHSGLDKRAGHSVAAFRGKFWLSLILSIPICCTAKTWDRMTKIFAQKRMRLDDLVSSTLPISKWRKPLICGMQKQSVKVLMYPEQLGDVPQI